MLVAALTWLGAPVMALDNACSASTYGMILACQSEIHDDFAEAMTICFNIVDDEERDSCFDETVEGLDEEGELCDAQADARAQLCTQLGDAAYDQSEIWVAENFVDPDEIGVSVAPNPWFNLTVGTHNEFFGDGEVIIVEVTNEIKLINGVECRTANDLVQEDGLNVEDTDDWYAQDIDGNVWYCGEISLNYEFFEGDDPETAELVDIEGSWKAFRDGAQPGILVHAEPEVGTTYRQEISWGDAEDVAEVLSVTGAGLLSGDECESDDVTVAVTAHAEAMCDDDCLITLEYSAIEPGVFAHKYYAPGEGIFLEVEQGICVVTRGVINEEEEGNGEEDDEEEEEE
jgi:hypothetical protein